MSGAAEASYIPVRIPEAQLLEHLPDAVLVWDLDRDAVLYVNRAARELFSISREQASTRRPDELLGGFVPGGRTALLAALERDREWRGRIDARSGEGARALVLEARLALLRDGPGRRLVLGSFREIAVRDDMAEAWRESERRLRESEARFRSLVDGAPVAISMSRHGRHLYGNPAFRKCFGLENDELVVGSSIFDRIVPEDHERIREYIARRYEGEDVPRSYEFTCIRGDGSRFPAQVEVGQIELPDGPASLAFLLDVSRRKRALEALRQNEERFRGVFDSRLMGFSIFDALSGETLAINDALLEMTGHTREQFESGQWNWQSVTLPEHRALDERAIGQARERGWWDPYEKEYLRADGSRIAVRVGSAPLPARPGQVVVAVQDITERKRADEHRELLIRELRHRVKNTLAVVQSLASQTLRRARSMKGFGEKFTGRLHALAETHDLLMREGWGSVGLREVMARTLAAQSTAGRVSLEGPEVQIEPNAAVSISMALHELATNAAKYGALSRARGRVSVAWSALEEPPRVELIWRERGGPPTHPPLAEGFGTRLLISLERELGARIERRFYPEGLECRIELPHHARG